MQLLKHVANAMQRAEVFVLERALVVMQHSHVIDMKNDWKLMTILVGANDVCLGLANNIIESRSDSIELDFQIFYVVILEMC